MREKAEKSKVREHKAERIGGNERDERVSTDAAEDSLEQIVAHTAGEIGLSVAEANAAVAAVAKNRKLADKFFRLGLNAKNRLGIRILENRFVRLKKRLGGDYTLAVSLLLAERAKIDYRRIGIPKEIYRDTMSDIKLWAHNYRVKRGAPGLDESEWLKQHFLLLIFRVGRLQFQLIKNTDPAFRNIGVRVGDPMIFVHIPQGEPLRTEECKRSFCAANRFFATTFPNYRYKIYLTESWLLYSKNGEFMKPDSNIMRFAALFTHVKDKPYQKEATSRIFGAEYAPREGQTALQTACRAYTDGGGRLGVGVGYIEKKAVDLWERR